MANPFIPELVCDLCKKINWNVEVDRLMSKSLYGYNEKISNDQKTGRQLWGAIFKITKTHDHSHYREQEILDGDRIFCHQLRRLAPHLDDAKLRYICKDSLDWWSEAFGA